MSPPVTPQSPRERLQKLRNGLLHLHKSLLDSERAAYERDIQRIGSPGEFLNLLLNDPWFNWLRELSQFIVLVDETLDLENSPTEAEAVRLIAQARELVSPAEEGNVFARRYWEAMQRDPSAVLAHRDMIKVFGEL
ncbi:MAG TPA: hypothetical protein VLW65_24070 [Bryobacteraceae bacterium]|nr:hypothetical protein [Bryobacteraceae bacterium]